MKILMVMLEGAGGMYQYGALLANYLNHKHDVSIIVPVGSDKFFFDSEIKVISLPLGDTKRNFFKSFLRMDYFYRFLKTINNENPDIIHFHNPYNPWIVPLLPFLSRYKKIISIPEGELHGGMDKRFDLLIGRNLHIRFCDAIISLSYYDKKLIKKYSRGKPIYCVPHGENNLFIKLTKPEIKEENILLFFGGISPFKGLDYLLKAFRIVQQKHPEVQLIIAGRGNLKRYDPLIKNLKGIQIDNKFIPHHMVAEYFQRAKVVALPYVEVDHSGILPLAFAFRKTVVATTLVEEIENEKTGLVVPPQDSESLANALLRCFEDNDLRDTFKKNIEIKVKKDMNWVIISSKVIEIYNNILKA